jgi:nucleoside-diphosphate-sugar epimerase
LGSGEIVRILVTGATGFIGRHLVSALESEHEVIRLARRPSPILRSAAIIEDLAAPIPIDPDVVDRLDVIVHTAAMTSHADCQANPRSAIATNLRGTAKVVALARHHGARLIYLSSGDVYGYHDSPVDENSPPAPIDIYSRTKRWAERHVVTNLPACSVLILRLFHVYGPGMPSDRLLPRFVRMIASGEAGFCDPRGGPVLGLTHIDDVVRDIRRLLETDAAGTFNLGGDDALPIRDIFHLVANAMGSGVRCAVRQTPASGNLVADSRRLGAVTGQRPTTRFSHAIHEVVRHELLSRAR